LPSRRCAAHPIPQAWPFFAVAAPEDTMLTRAWHRLSAGKYPVHRTQDFFGRRL
jgi:hypothetical protein